MIFDFEHFCCHLRCRQNEGGLVLEVLVRSLSKGIKSGLTEVRQYPLGGIIRESSSEHRFFNTHLNVKFTSKQRCASFWGYLEVGNCLRLLDSTNASSSEGRVSQYLLHMHRIILATTKPKEILPDFVDVTVCTYLLMSC